MRVLQNLRIDQFFIIILIIALPLIFYLKHLIPDEILGTELFGYEFELSNVLWYLTLKIYVIVLLSIWYFTCKNWWKIAILIPLTIEIFKLFSFFNFRNDTFDEKDFLTSLPITLPIIIILILISIKLKRFLFVNKIRNEISLEIENVFQQLQNKTDPSLDKKQFMELKRNKSRYNKKDYLIKLIELRNKIIDS